MAPLSRLGDCEVNIAIGKEEDLENGYQKKSFLGRIAKISKGLKTHGSTFVTKIWKLGKEDSSRVIHSMKVGRALSMVSLFYLMEPLFDGVGDNAIWAVMTVVVVLEFTVGATLSKGLNRGIGIGTFEQLLYAGCVDEEYFELPNSESLINEHEMDETSEDPIYKVCWILKPTRSLWRISLDAWEPTHGRFQHRHPWKQYVT